MIPPRATIGTPRNERICGCARGPPPRKRGSRRRRSVRCGPSESSIPPSSPCVRGSGPIAATSSSLMPDVMNRSNAPSPSGTPIAAYRAPASSRAASTSRWSTFSTDSSAAIASTAAFIAASAELSRVSLTTPTLRGGARRVVGHPAEAGLGRWAEPPAPLAEGEDVGAQAGGEEPDLHGARPGRAVPADELVHARLAHGARARGVDVEAVVVARRRAIEAHLEAHGAVRRRQDEVHVAPFEAVRDRPRGRAEHHRLLAGDPPPGDRPLVELELVGGPVGTALAPRAAEVGLGRVQAIPVGGGRQAAGVDLHERLVHAQQLLDRPLALGV